MYLCRVFKIIKEFIYERGYVNDVVNDFVNMKDFVKLKEVSVLV